MKTDLLINELTSFLGDRFTVSESIRSNYARGEDVFDPVLSQGIAFPNNNEEVSKIIKSVNVADDDQGGEGALILKLKKL